MEDNATKTTSDHVMKTDLQALYSEAKALWTRTGVLLFEFQNAVQQVPRDDLVDCGYLLREMRNAFDDMRKNCDAKQLLAGRRLAGEACSYALRGEDLKLEGELATASAEVTTIPRLPKRGSREYVELLRWLKVPEEVIATNRLDFSFTEMQKLVAEMQSRGENPPPGIVAAHTDAVAVFRKKRGLNEKKEDQTDE
jgi:hypothetical protein